MLMGMSICDCGSYSIPHVTTQIVEKERKCNWSSYGFRRFCISLSLYGYAFRLISIEFHRILGFQNMLLGSGIVNIFESDVGWKNSFAIPPTSSVTARQANRATTNFHLCVIAKASSWSLASKRNSSPPHDLSKKLEFFLARGYLFRSMLLLKELLLGEEEK